MNHALDRIAALLRRADRDEPPFPATLLFEEGWMLRLVLDWFAESGAAGHALSFAPGARWFSEARLRSAFLPRRRGDPLGEGYTHVDGVIGHFRVGWRCWHSTPAARPSIREMTPIPLSPPRATRCRIVT